MKAHSFSDVGIADGGNFGFDMILCGPIQEALVCHDGSGDGVEA